MESLRQGVSWGKGPEQSLPLRYQRTNTRPVYLYTQSQIGEINIHTTCGTKSSR